jgi:putative transposase
MYDTTHFSRGGVAVSVAEDLVSRQSIADVMSADETSTQVEIVFIGALAVEGLLAVVEARADGLLDPTVDDPARPILLAVPARGTADDVGLHPYVYRAVRQRPTPRSPRHAR